MTPRGFLVRMVPSRVAYVTMWLPLFPAKHSFYQYFSSVKSHRAHIVSKCCVTQSDGSLESIACLFVGTRLFHRAVVFDIFWESARIPELFPTQEEKKMFFSVQDPSRAVTLDDPSFLLLLATFT